MSLSFYKSLFKLSDTSIFSIMVCDKLLEIKEKNKRNFSKKWNGILISSSGIRLIILVTVFQYLDASLPVPKEEKREINYRYN